MKESVMKKIISALAAFFLLIPVALMANGTAAGTAITNTVNVSYSNLGNTAYTTAASETNTVQAIFGISAAFSNTVSKFVQPGSATTFAITVTNKGNTATTVVLSNYRIATGGASSWFQNFYTNVATNGGAVKTLSLAEDETRTFYLYVRADAAAVDGHSRTNVWGTAILNKGVYNTVYNASPLSYYVGMDTTTRFGGRDNITNYIAIAVVQAPNIIVSKRSDVTNSATFLALVAAADAKRVVPGSELVFAITWTNAGSGTVKSLKFTDLIKADYEYVTGSMTYDNTQRVTSGYFTAYQNNVTATRTLADNGSVTAGAASPNFGLNGSYGASTVTFEYTQPVTGNTKGTLMYKVRVR